MSNPGHGARRITSTAATALARDTAVSQYSPLGRMTSSAPYSDGYQPIATIARTIDAIPTIQTQPSVLGSV